MKASEPKWVNPVLNIITHLGSGAYDFRIFTLYQQKTKYLKYRFMCHPLFQWTKQIQFFEVGENYIIFLVFSSSKKEIGHVKWSIIQPELTRMGWKHQWNIKCKTFIVD